ncbi:MAG: CPBP family glutamic-type intramembrane protease [Bacillota bacterium]|nr:CPBP family glutamic-type intramembrane protease [Bacillota bacterium]
MDQEPNSGGRSAAVRHLVAAIALVPLFVLVLGLTRGVLPDGAVTRWCVRLLVLAGPALIAPASGWLTWTEAGLYLRPRKGVAEVLGLVLAAAAASCILMLSGQWFASALSERAVSGVRFGIAWPVVLSAIPGSVSEELLFRGTLQGLANKITTGRVKAGGLEFRRGTLAVALGFGLVHLIGGGGAPGWTTLPQWRITQTLFGTLHGVVFGYVRDESGPVWIPAALHVMVNAYLITLVVA